MRLFVGILVRPFHAQMAPIVFPFVRGFSRLLVEVAVVVAVPFL